MPPPIDPYASLSSIAALSAQMNSNFARSNGKQQSKISNQNFIPSGYDAWSAFGSETSNQFNNSSSEENRRREEQERADYEFALKLSQQHDHNIPHRPPPPVPSHRMPNQSNVNHFTWK